MRRRDAEIAQEFVREFLRRARKYPGGRTGHRDADDHGHSYTDDHPNSDGAPGLALATGHGASVPLREAGSRPGLPFELFGASGHARRSKHSIHAAVLRRNIGRVEDPVEKALSDVVRTRRLLLAVLCHGRTSSWPVSASASLRANV
jgi:hypothetical protein